MIAEIAHHASRMVSDFGNHQLVLLLSRCAGGLQPLTHLIEGGGVDFASRISLPEYVQGGRLHRWHAVPRAILIVIDRRLPVPEAEPAYHAPDEER
jgi:hypothetical protein